MASNAEVALCGFLFAAGFLEDGGVDDRQARVLGAGEQAFDSQNLDARKAVSPPFTSTIALSVFDLPVRR